MKLNGNVAELVKWITGGTAAGIVLYALQVLGGEGISEVLKAWGPGFATATVLGGVAIWRIDRRWGEGIAAVNGMAEAQRGLTGAVQRIVEKDDRRAQATEAAIGFVAQQNEEILKLINERLPKT